MTKNESISKTYKATKERRKTQICVVRELKVDKSHLNKYTLNALHRLFLEAKWLYNHAISQEDIFQYDYKVDKIPVLVKDVYEERPLEIISSQMKQSLINSIHQSIINLSKIKKTGKKVGALHFKSLIKSIDLKQFGVTYQLKGNRIRIQNITQWFPVRGISQIKDYELANAKLLRKAGNYFVKVTCFKKKEPVASGKGDPIGIDLGVHTPMTLSNGVQIEYVVHPTAQHIRACKNLSRKTMHSSNWYKEIVHLNQHYEISNNKKKDIKNKILCVLKQHSELIIFQNDSIKGWQRLWGKKIFGTGIGGIISKLKDLETSVQVSKWFPSTQMCHHCGCRNNISLEQRVWVCCFCGKTHHRDRNSALNIRDEGLKQIGRGPTEFKPVENDASTQSLLDKLNLIPGVCASMCSVNQEANGFSHW